MTKDEMSRIVERALNTYNSADYRVTTLPAYIAHAIAAEQTLNDAGVGAEILSLQKKLEEARAVIAAIKAVLP